jgi:hypothetical protein
MQMGTSTNTREYFIMRKTRFLCCALATAFLLPAASFADPPAHAPAHGWRNKHREPSKHEESPRRLEVVFDSEQGLEIAVGVPGVYFHLGKYYRHRDNGWQMSATGLDGWRVEVAASVPDLLRKKHPGVPAKIKSHPGPRRHGKKQ